MKKLKTNLGCFILALFCSCSSTTEITATWKAEEIAQKQYSNLLIAALIQNLAVRQSIENHFAERLADRNVQTSKSLNMLKPGFLDEGEPSREKILDILEEAKTEGILTITLIDVDEDERYIPGGVMGPTYVPMGQFGYYRTFPGYFHHRYGTAWNPGYVVEDKEYFLETNLYDSETMELVWSAQSRTVNPASADAFAREYVGTLKNELREAGLIP
jgi:hypothetical protein